MNDPYPAKLHTQTFAKALLELYEQDVQAESSPSSQAFLKHVVILQGQHTSCRDDTDRELPFHQEANFHYLTGCHIPSSILILTITSNSSHKETQPPLITRKLFIPPYNAEDAMWSVPPPSKEEILRNQVDTGSSGFGKMDFEEEELGYLEDRQLTEGGVGQYGTPATVLIGLLQGVGHVLVHTLVPMGLERQCPPIPEDLVDIYSEIKASPSISSTTLNASSEYLQKALHTARLLKSSYEIALIREACRITSGAHEVVMRELGKQIRRQSEINDGRKGVENHMEVGKGHGRHGKEGLDEWKIESEQDAEAVFVASCKRAGADQAYLPIVASGARASTLHYVCNDRVFPNIRTIPGTSEFTSPPLQGRGCCGSIPLDSPSDLTKISENEFVPQVLLIDAGCEVRGGYASDVTRTIPVGNRGRFLNEGREIYGIVLKMQKEAEAMLKPGVHWDDLHFACHRILCEEFLRLGIFHGASVEEILLKQLTVAFYPHGLGHSLGLDVHDSLQLLRSEHLDIPQNSLDHPKLFQYLRIRRPIQEHMVLTIEPGCYFSPDLMNHAGIRDSEFVNVEVLDRYIGVGGVRIEDVVVVTKDGCENLTIVGREVDWIEGVCSGQL